MSEENINDLPDVDRAALTAMVDQREDKGQDAMPEVQEPTTTTDGEPDFDLAQFKNPKDLLKSYKEIQGVFTKASQENKTLKEQLASLNERLELASLQAAPTVTHQTKSFDEMFVENPQQAIDVAVEQKMHFARIADVLESEEGKNPEEFQERYAVAMHLKQSYPQLTQSAAGVKKLFELGDKLRIANARKNADRIIKMTFGEDIDIAKFRDLIKKDGTPDQTPKINKNLAYMPDTSGNRIRTGTDTGRNTIDTHINDAAEKGDIDSVITNVFKKALSA